MHCVFTCIHPHGDVYACISPCVNGFHNQYPVVPHMINLPYHDRNMRKELNIPEDAVVYGLYGGYESFNLKHAQDAVYEVARDNPNIYFLLVNLKPFRDPLPNLIYHKAIVDLDKKVEFINTCDAMVWGRSGGETFGLCIGEFSTKNKPVICTNDGSDSHIRILGDKAILYNTKEDLYKILTHFNRDEISKRDWNAYRDYEPEKVMKIFKEVFIDLPSNVPNRYGFDVPRIQYLHR
jgi:hypothetical protein